jgi:hypothetical protein
VFRTVIALKVRKETAPFLHASTLSPSGGFSLD